MEVLRVLLFRLFLNFGLQGENEGANRLIDKFLNLSLIAIIFNVKYIVHKKPRFILPL